MEAGEAGNKSIACTRETVDEVYKHYNHEETVEIFLERNKPSQVSNSITEWIQVDVPDEEKDPEYKNRRAAMCEEWLKLLENRPAHEISPETLKQLAVKYRITSGKWLIFCSSDEIDSLWSDVVKSLIDKELGNRARVSTQNKMKEKHVICVFTKDFTDEEDVERVEMALRELKISTFLQYEADAYALILKEQYTGANKLIGIYPCVYRSIQDLGEQEDEDDDDYWPFHFLKGNFKLCLTKEELEEAERLLKHNDTMAEFVCYDHKEPLEEFFEKYMPSKVNEEQAYWIQISNKEKMVEMRDGIGSSADSIYSRVMAILEEWQSMLEIQAIKKITPKTIKNLAVKYKIITGKWLIFTTHEKIDGIWRTVARAVVDGKLGHAAKVSTRNDRPSHVICIYTKDFNNEDDVRRVEKGLREVGILCHLKYKPDVYTYLNIYKEKNSLGIYPFVYLSKEISQPNPENHVRKRYNFSFAKQFMEQ